MPNSFAEPQEVAVVQPLKKKMEVFLDLKNDEKQCIRDLERSDVHLRRGETLIDEGEPQQYIYVLQRGWCMVARTLDDGRRQITSFAIPGDFLCFNAGLFALSSRSISTLTDVHAYRLQMNDLLQMFSACPRLAAAFAWCNAQDESILAERLTSVGRRSAYERMAHLFIELWRRLELLDLTENEEFLLPVTREQLADAVSMTTLHVYRTLRKLQDNKLVQLGAKGVKILDMDGLHEAAKFEEAYLHYTEIPKQTERMLGRVSNLRGLDSGFKSHAR